MYKPGEISMIILQRKWKKLSNSRLELGIVTQWDIAKWPVQIRKTFARLFLGTGMDWSATPNARRKPILFGAIDALWQSIISTIWVKIGYFLIFLKLLDRNRRSTLLLVFMWLLENMKKGSAGLNEGYLIWSRFEKLKNLSKLLNKFILIHLVVCYRNQRPF